MLGLGTLNVKESLLLDNIVTDPANWILLCGSSRKRHFARVLLCFCLQERLLYLQKKRIAALRFSHFNNPTLLLPWHLKWNLTYFQGNWISDLTWIVQSEISYIVQSEEHGVGQDAPLFPRLSDARLHRPVCSNQRHWFQGKWIPPVRIYTFNHKFFNS